MSRILVVEDNEMNREMLARRLERRGFHVSIAVDGSEGIQKARTEMPDLILMDLNLPEIDGLEATTTLKQDRNTSRIPVIALSAYAMVTDKENAMRAGCDDFATKPIEFNGLLAKIYTLLSRKHT
ncbi:MAG TPA: response regulator, partial [Terriglobia bacterium]|nr:response regulator [Terriglobia bacterium]